MADKAKREAEDIRVSRRKEASLIPFGQPILVGHHSERKHRNAIARADRQHGKEAALYEKAEYYERKARKLGTGGVSSDDPEAIVKLKSQLVDLESRREHAKSVNRLVAGAVRKAKKSYSESEIPDYFSIVISLQLEEKDRNALLGVVRAYQG